LINRAGRAISNLALPNAQAQTNAAKTDLSDLAVKAPAPLPSGFVQSEVSDVSNLYEGGRFAAPIVSSSGSSNGAKTASAENSSGAQSRSVAQNTGQSGQTGQKDASASTTSSKTAATESRTGPGQKANRSPASTSSSGMTSKENAASKGDALDARTEALIHHADLLKLFKNHPDLALKKLKARELSHELEAARIEVKDDQGNKYGSKLPVLKIWYDVVSKTFAGLPMP
jgi:hypothetical protein